MGKKVRGKGEGCISLRKDGRYLITIQVSTNSNGTPKRIYRYAKTHKEAIEILTKLRMEYLQGVDSTTGNVAVGSWCQIWLDKYKKQLALSTKASYQMCINSYINEFIGGVKLNMLTQKQVQYALDNVFKNGENSSSLFIKVYNVLNGAIKKAIELGMLVKNPCIGIEFPKDNANKKKIFTLEEQMAFEKALDNDRNKVLFLTYLYTGARLGELPPLTWKDVDFENRVININKKAIVVYNYNSEAKKTSQIVENSCKTESSRRVVVIPIFLRDELKMHKEIQIKQSELLKKEWDESNLVFPTSNGTVPYTRNIQEKFKRIIDKIGIKDVTMHSLRHTYASRLFEKNADIKVISEQLGHKSIKVTYDTYVHVMPDKRLNEIDKLDTLYA